MIVFTYFLRCWRNSFSELELLNFFKTVGVSQVALVVKNACQCRIHKRCGFDPWVGKILWRRAWQGNHYSCLENPMDGGAWWARARRVAESQTWLTSLWSSVMLLLRLLWIMGFSAQCLQILWERSSCVWLQQRKKVRVRAGRIRQWKHEFLLSSDSGISFYWRSHHHRQE